ncbi:head decoration protein [Xenorhabdus budapestensis]|uniref:Head decoration protein n=1 Tax=Xenorhabdus budapestensis TaxID=290110 RepID=A0A2D0IKU6_XENBU|nr:head decoration protein [Xenorhabdus budapestensis]PHM22415.1 hypothetical protein Xbud_03762 [Xenorhabdus budapestensis]QTL38797.1 head decoration protein [Xenorhabdus budapestensis]QTL41013.1 head decoration protein [Xenorhabdus budapestensis]
MENIGPNPFAPGMTSSMFIPDQLIAGQLQLVTDSVTMAQFGLLKRGSVLGMNKSGEYVLSVKTATDGSEKPAAILVDAVDTTVSSQTAGVYLMGEFNAHRIIFDKSWTLAELKTALRPFSIFLKDSTPGF